MNDLEVSLRIKGDGSGLTAVLKNSQADLDSFAASAQAAGAKAAQGMETAAAGTRDFAKELGNLMIQGKDVLSPVAASAQSLPAAINPASESMKGLSGATAGVTRELAVMTGELLRGNFTRLTGSLTVLANRMEILPGLMNPVSIGLAALAAGVGLLIYQAVQSEQYVAKLQNAIELTGGQSARTATQLRDLTTDIERSGASSKVAQGAVLELAASGKFVGDTLEQAARGAAAFADLTGEKIDVAVKEFEKLGTDPSKALVELNDRTHSVSLGVIALVAQTQSMGNTFGATTIATDAISQSLQEVEKKSKAVNDANGFWGSLAHSTALYGQTQAGLVNTYGMVAEATEKARQAQERLNAARNIVNNQVLTSASGIILALQKEKDKLDELTATYGKGKAGLVDYTIAKAEAAVKSTALLAAEQVFLEVLKETHNIFKAGREALQQYSNAINLASGPLAQLEKGLRASAAAADTVIEAHKKHKVAVDESAKSINSLAAYVDTLTAKSETGAAAIQDKLNASLDLLHNKTIETAKTSKNLGDVLGYMVKGTRALQAAAQEATDKLATEDSIMAELQKKLNEDVRLSGLSADARKIETQLIELQNKAIKDHVDITQANIDKARGWIAVAEQQERTNELLMQTQKQWVSIAVSGFDSVDKSIANLAVSGFKKWSDFGKSLVDDTKQFVAAMISEFLKLEVFNGIINNLFHLNGTSSELATFANLAGGRSVGGSSGSFGSVVQAFGGGGGAATGGGLTGGGEGAGAGASLFSPSTWLSAGQSLFSGFSSGFGSLWNGTPGATGSSFLGGPSYFTDANGFMQGTPYAPSLAGNIIGIGGGALAAYNEYNAAGGGLGGAVGGAAYGLGTLTATGAIGGVLSGAGASAGAAGALGSVGLGAIPVIGWVALAAMAINMITGGGLFGTAATKAVGGNFSESIGANGATLWGEETFKGKKPLFGGSYYEEHNIPVDPKAQQAADAFYTALVSGRDAFAAQFNVQMGDIVGGVFHQTLDKNGKVTGTDDTVLGVKYTGETQQQFGERLQADNYLAVLDKMGIGASQFVAGLQTDADKLFAAVQDMAQATELAQADIKKGLGLLGPSGSLADVVNETIKLNVSGEALAATYQRLQVESHALQSSLDYATISAGKTSAQMVEFADSAAKAAGGAQQLAQLVAQFNKDFFTAGETTAATISSLRATVQREGAALGLGPNMTDAQFKLAYQQALPTLTPEQLVAWQQFGVDLYSLNDAVAKAGDSYAQFMAQFMPAASQFEQAMVKVQDALAANVKQANDLAVAAGKSGVSAEDLGRIISKSVAEGVLALQALETEAEGIARKLFGDPNAVFNAMGVLGPNQTGQSAAQQQAAQQFVQAAQLLGDLGQIGAVTGLSLQQLAAKFNIPLDKFATILGTNGDGLKQQFNQQEAMAKAALDTAGNTKLTADLLANIYAVSQGKPAPFSDDQLASDANGNTWNVATVSGNTKPGAHTGSTGSSGTGQPGTTGDMVVSAVQLGNKKADLTNDTLASIDKTLKDIASDRKGGLNFAPERGRTNGASGR